MRVGYIGMPVGSASRTRSAECVFSSPDPAKCPEGYGVMGTVALVAVMEGAKEKKCSSVQTEPYVCHAGGTRQVWKTLPWAKTYIAADDCKSLYISFGKSEQSNMAVIHNHYSEHCFKLLPQTHLM